jgi:hypothetical protein
VSGGGGGALVKVNSLSVRVRVLPLASLLQVVYDRFEALSWMPRMPGPRRSAVLPPLTLSRLSPASAPGLRDHPTCARLLATLQAHTADKEALWVS